jgi:hypothetical protein
MPDLTARDWASLRADYERGEVPVKFLQRRYKLSSRALLDEAAKRGWRLRTVRRAPKPMADDPRLAAAILTLRKAGWVVFWHEDQWRVGTLLLGKAGLMAMARRYRYKLSCAPVSR